MIDSKEEVQSKLFALCPDFHVQWERDDNCCKADDGYFTFCGLFSAFSFYMRQHFFDLPDATRQKVLNFVESCLIEEGEPDNDLDNAACTCFLENLSSEGELSRQLRKYMGPKSTAFFNEWDTPRDSK